MSAEVSSIGELVVLQMGNVAFSMHFPLALQLSKMLLDDGRIARRSAGFKDRRIRVSGLLSDAEQSEPKPSRWQGKAPPQINEVAVRVIGTQVQMRLGKEKGGTTATFSYDTALTISQWLRIVGKKARNHAGEKSHWLELAN